jgi:osmotically-inducible protein OsmY
MHMRQLTTVLALCSLPFIHGCAAVLVGGAAAGGYAAGEDARTLGTIAEDEAIEFKIRNRVAEKHPNSHISPVSYNRMALINGTATSEAAKADIEKIVRGVENVKGVYNEMVVGPNRTFPYLAGDGVLTSKVKARMVDARKFNPLHVKVVSDDGTVYLLGIVKRSEADAATEVARTTSGVKRVVRMFEYQD